ncbi:alpha/beta fold hydrolase [Paraburkholderia youngii]|uniref:alpha/beta fold hydrolase n=1 Tax=Paraburkholderia youngii TaxID=2782701 RepID=UPI003D263666
MNPGGPGARGLAFPLLVSTLWLLGNSANPVGQKLLQLSDAYDLIGFDPRGVGSSAQLVCSSSAPARAISFTDRSPAGVRAQMIDSRDLASACGGTPLTPYINTEYTARDMEVIRAALGYEKLNYYGTSYSTALGARYASLFPGRTGRLVLDSVIDITLPLAEVALRRLQHFSTHSMASLLLMSPHKTSFSASVRTRTMSKRLLGTVPLGSQVGLAEP